MDAELDLDLNRELTAEVIEHCADDFCCKGEQGKGQVRRKKRKGCKKVQFTQYDVKLFYMYFYTYYFNVSYGWMLIY